MRKKIFSILIIIVLMVSINSVHAATSLVYTVRYTSENTYSSNVKIRNYTANIDGIDSMVYCLDPGRQFGGSGNSTRDTIYRKVDPSTSIGKEYKFDVAATYIYQHMVDSGYTSNTGTNRVIGTTAFRLIELRYVRSGCVNGTVCATQSKYLNGGAKLVKTSAVNEGIRLYNEAVAVAESGKTYQQLIDEGILWGPEFKVDQSAAVEGAKIKQEGNKIYYTFAIGPSDTSKTPQYWSEYLQKSSVTCSNSTVQCTFTPSQEIEVTPAGALARVEIDISKWDRKDMGINFVLPYCDSRSSTYNMVVMNKIGDKGKQFMLAILPNDSCPSVPSILNVSPATISSRYPHATIPVPTPSLDSCSCNTATGVYEYLDKNGNKTTCDPAKEDCTAFKNGKECPGTCEKDKSCSIEDNKYYCKDHNGDGLGDECDRDKYVEDCLHPECSHPSNDEYYCNDKDGDGGGDKCTQTEYEKDCECPKLEDACDKDPNSPECEEFNRKCINCSPTVSIPSDCAELVDQPNDYLKLKGSISDINKKITECNKYANQVKACVIGKNDAQGASYQDTTKNNSGNVSSGQSKNRYCSIWCEETYDFDLPSAVNSQSGGYFTLSMSISGTRNCYTSGSESSATPINKEQFEKDLEAKQREVIDAWNEYSHWLEGTNPSHEHTRPKNASDDGCISWEEVVVGRGDDGEEITESRCSERCNAHVEVTQYYYEWNYRAYDYNGNPITRHQSEIEDGDASCYTCGCNSDEGESLIPTFKKRSDDAKATLIQKINELNQIISEYNSCSGNVSNTNQSDLGNQINTTGWINDMKWEPDIEFTYHENYLDDKEGKFVGNGASSSSEATYCTGDTDGEYTCLSGKNTVSNNNNVPTTEVKRVLICNEGSCGWSNYNVSTAKWVQKSVNKSEAFEPQTNFSTFVQYGTIAKNQSGQYTLYTPLPSNAFPVSLVTKTGVFNFNFKFSGIGQSNQDGSVGRLIGTAGKDILSAFNKLDPSLKCTASDNLEGDQTADTNVGYVCHYVNNCDGCEFECEDHNCTFPGCNGDCEFTCKNCIFDGNRSSYTFRSVSLSNLNPNDRPVGYNWDSTDLTGNIKARVTKEEIESLGERVYLKPQYSYTLTPQNLTEVRKYNDKAKIFTNSQIPSDYTSRLNTSDAVYCENVEFGGHNYNIKCKSGFLDLVDKMKNVFAKDVYRITADDNAWELFTDTRYCTNGTCLEAGIGPAWRIRSDIE